LISSDFNIKTEFAPSKKGQNQLKKGTKRDKRGFSENSKSAYTLWKRTF